MKFSFSKKIIRNTFFFYGNALQLNSHSRSEYESRDENGLSLNLGIFELVFQRSALLYFGILVLNKDQG